jgi:cytoskeletal protein RodZ
MDTDLYQGISLGLMGLIVILLVVLMIVVGRLRARLERAVRQASEEAVGAASVTAEPTPDASRQEAAAQPAVTETAAAEAQAVPAQTAAEPAQTTAEPAERQQAREREPATTAASEPQEQPFERDGRWWYRRGDELLVYDEQTGQWKPAPQAEPGQTETQAPGAAPAQTQAEAFWKCPSCGAVNGSTATTCRMCFSARP